MVDLYLDRRPVSSIFIVKNAECFIAYSNRCIIIEKLILQEVFMFIVDTKISFFYTSPGFLDYTCDEKDG